MKFFYSLLLAFTIISCQTKKVAFQEKVNLIEVVQNPETVLVDVRVSEQFQEATAKNSINIPLAELENQAESLKDKKVVVFCNKGIQADRAYEILKKKGVEVYDGTTLQNIKAIQNLNH